MNQIEKGHNVARWTTFDIEGCKIHVRVAKQIPEIYYSPIWNWLAKIDTPDDYTVVFTFSSPRYHEWSYNLYQTAIIPEHIWAKKSKDDVLTGAMKRL